MNLEKTMRRLPCIGTYLQLGSLVYLSLPFWALSQTSTVKTSPQQADAERDGQHDFDFEIGTWKIHLSRLQDRLAGSKTWIKFDGTSVTRKVWGGRANLDEFETARPTAPIERLTLH